MSQLIACKSQDGIVFGADGKAIDVDANGNLIELKVDRLHQLSDHTAILNGGAAAGESMCESLKRFVDGENLSYVDDIYQAALPFLATEYERFMRKTCEIQPIDPIHQVTFILGGYTANHPEKPFHLYLLWTKRKLPLLDSDEIGTSFSVPRIIKLEHRLHHIVQQRGELDSVITVVRQEMEHLAEIDEEVSEPLSYAYVSKDGFKRI
jgi:20S proteasome alpha/beta subunit